MGGVCSADDAEELEYFDRRILEQIAKEQKIKSDPELRAFLAKRNIPFHSNLSIFDEENSSISLDKKHPLSESRESTISNTSLSIPLTKPVWEVPKDLQENTEPRFDQHRNCIVIRMHDEKVRFDTQLPALGNLRQIFNPHEYEYYLDKINESFDHQRTLAQQHKKLARNFSEEKSNEFDTLVRELRSVQDETLHKVRNTLAAWNEKAFHAKGFHWDIFMFTPWKSAVSENRRSARIPELLIAPWGVNHARLSTLHTTKDRLKRLREFKENGMVSESEFESCRNLLVKARDARSSRVGPGVDDFILKDFKSYY